MVRTEIHPHPAKTGPTGRPTERSRPEPVLPALTRIERTLRRPVPVVQPVEGLVSRGWLLGYARGRDRQRYAVVDTGRELAALRTDDVGLAAGCQVRAVVNRTDADRRRQLWRLRDIEREPQRERAR